MASEEEVWRRKSTSWKYEFPHTLVRNMHTASHVSRAIGDLPVPAGHLLRLDSTVPDSPAALKRSYCLSRRSSATQRLAWRGAGTQCSIPSEFGCYKQAGALGSKQPRRDTSLASVLAPSLASSVQELSAVHSSSRRRRRRVAMEWNYITGAPTLVPLEREHSVPSGGKVETMGPSTSGTHSDHRPRPRTSPVPTLGLGSDSERTNSSSQPATDRATASAQH